MEQNVEKKEMIAAEVASVKSVNPMDVKTAEGRKQCSKRKCNLDLVLESARRLYLRQVVKDAKTWKAVIERSIQANFPMRNYELPNFLSDLGKRMFRLLDSKRFEKDCEKYQLDLLAAATYISIQPITRLYAVLDNGLDSVDAGFNAYICDMGERIFDFTEFPNADVQLGYTLKA